MADDVVADVDMIDTGSQEPVASPAETIEGQGQSATPTTQTEVKVETPEPEVSAGEQDEPFNKNPKFKERITEIEEKYGTKASNWDAIAQIAERRPDIAILLVEEMEKDGRVPPGTAERAKKELEARKPEKAEEKKPAVTGEQEKLQEILENHPAVKYAKEKLEAEKREAQEKETAMETWLETFEKDKPDIAKSSDPLVTRQRINLEAQVLMKTKKLSFEDAMNQAYKWVVRRDELLEEYRQKGEISGLTSNIQQNAVSPVKGSTPPSSSGRALTEEERGAAKSMGVSEEEYRNLVDNKNSGVVD